MPTSAILRKTEESADRDRPDDPDAGLADDKKAEARELIGKIAKSVRGPSVESSSDEQAAAEQISKGEELDHAARP
jgi:hypothetical protein